MNLIKFFKSSLIILVIVNNSYAQNLFLEDLKTPSLIVNLSSCFKFSIENGYYLDSIFIENGNLQDISNNQLCLVSNQPGTVIINFVINSNGGNTFLIKKSLNSIEPPKPNLKFHNSNKKPLKVLKLEHLDSVYLFCNWSSVHSNCYLKSYKIIVLFKDSNSTIFSCHNNYFPKDFREIIKSRKEDIEEVVLFNIKVKTEIGELILDPINFINN